MQDTPTIHPLDALIREICGSFEAKRFGALSSACQNLGGTVIQPGSASHMHEISVPGVYSGGADRQELVLNWLRNARALHVADHKPRPVAIEEHPAKRGIQIAGAASMNMVREVSKIEAFARMAAHYREMHRQRRMAKRRLLAWRAVHYGTAILIGATLVSAIHDAPAKIAATVLEAQHSERW